MYTKSLSELIPVENDLDPLAAENIYEEMIRKLCNIRIQEFLSSLMQRLALEKGCASTKGQNLRDHF